MLQQQKQIKSLILLPFMAALAMLSNLAFAGANLNNIEFASLPGDQVEIRLSFDKEPPQPKGYTIEKPARIALDLMDVNSKLESKYHNLGVGNARSLTVMGVKDRTRVIINLTELVSYDTKVDGNDLLITVGRDVQDQLVQATSGDAAGTEMEGLSTTESSAALSVPVTGDGPQLQEIDFRRGEGGEGQVIVTLSDASVSVDMRDEGGKVVIEFIGVALPDQLRRRLDVIDFATPVQTIDAVTEEGNALLVIDPEGDYEYLAYQADNEFTVSIKPVSAEELERQKKDQFLFTGEKLSLNFQDIEVRAVLQLIADFTGLNLVASDTVGGRITLRLQNVPWDQALDLILKTKGLDKRKVGNVMLVAPADEIAAREKLELETTRQVEELAPLRTEYIQVNYAKAGDLAELMAGGEEGGLLSPRGTVSVDARTNTLIVNDTSNKLEEMRILLSKLDIPVQQVLIEARVVVATSDVTQALGVKWGNVNYNVKSGSLDLVDGELQDTRVFDYTAGGSSQTLWDINEREDDGTIEVTRSPSGPENLIVDMGVDVANATSFALGYLSDSGFLEMELSAIEADGQGEVIATPKILTADQQTARIASGKEIPYQEASSSGATTVAFKEATLSLEVTPHITPDGRIIMDLDIHQDSVEELAEGQGVPSINTNQIQTQVLVSDGETVVLGGVFQESSTDTIIKTPFFGDLPLIGRFFRKTTHDDAKLELLVFITPKLVKGILAQQ